ncbi:G protein-coupled receptor, rhodopsin-like,GPCR, rhodopsin-like, 7TM [Cinara cedri]|uniref:G protein-coupled receptor, rhodopsin-like,GPCR, rhodopsin-like, 7TM n=1 Tax=Cinara cedri TaxID=506608 RepID=A0A5E4M189_9HEMI|nr:G protein-coupled receptor, rhodopsin-like,GPCR, rhodopsin-like, 7TM [Cinara cedri]
MANGSGGGGNGGGLGVVEALQNVAPNLFPPIYIPTVQDNGTEAFNYTDAIEREYVEDYVFQAAFSFVYLLIFTLGVFGNVLVVYVVWANKHMRTVTNIFIVNLAVSDIMLCGLAVPFTPLYTFTGTSISYAYNNSILIKIDFTAVFAPLFRFSAVHGYPEP